MFGRLLNKVKVKSSNNSSCNTESDIINSSNKNETTNQTYNKIENRNSRSKHSNSNNNSKLNENSTVNTLNSNNYTRVNSSSHSSNNNSNTLLRLTKLQQQQIRQDTSGSRSGSGNRSSHSSISINRGIVLQNEKQKQNKIKMAQMEFNRRLKTVELKDKKFRDYQLKAPEWSEKNIRNHPNTNSNTNTSLHGRTNVTINRNVLTNSNPNSNTSTITPVPREITRSYSHNLINNNNKWVPTRNNSNLNMKSQLMTTSNRMDISDYSSPDEQKYCNNSSNSINSSNNIKQRQELVERQHSSHYLSPNDLTSVNHPIIHKRQKVLTKHNSDTRTSKYNYKGSNYKQFSKNYILSKQKLFNSSQNRQEYKHNTHSNTNSNSNNTNYNSNSNSNSNSNHQIIETKSSDTVSTRTHSSSRKSKIVLENVIKYSDSKRRAVYRIKDEKFVLWDYYRPLRVLGVGAYAVVIEAIDMRDDTRVAIKKNTEVFGEVADAKRILREIKLLQHFVHDDIIKIIDVIPPPEDERDTFQDVYLVLPKMETTLKRVIESKKTLTNEHCLFIIYQILRGLRFIHSAGVIHRDLKPENILINGKNCNIKISDFGLSRELSQETGQLTEYVVTRWYRAPEVMVSACNYNASIDVWAVGCIFGELLIKRPLFPGNNHYEQLNLIFSVLGTPLSNDLEWITSKEAKEWVMDLPEKEPWDIKVVFPRATPEALDLLSKMLTVNPHKRITVEESLSHPFLYIVKPTNDMATKVAPKFELNLPQKKEFTIRHAMFTALANFTPRKKKKRKKHHSIAQSTRNREELKRKSAPQTC